MRGASALGELVAKYPEAPIRVMVVWMPIIDTDAGPPDPNVTAPLRDPRVEWYWDEERLLTPPMVETTMRLYRQGRAVPQLEKGDLLWDVITSFEPGAVWEDPFPAPAWYGMETVLNSLPFVEKRLRELSH